MSLKAIAFLRESILQDSTSPLPSVSGNENPGKNKSCHGQILEIFGDKQLPFISGYVWKEKKNKRKNQVSSHSQNKTQLCGKWKLLLDGAVFEGKSKELQKFRRMSH